jgi:general secretion pathway protein B
MSSILKALKKLEHDKAVRRPDSFRIDADILRGAAPRRSSSSGVILAAIVIFACGGAATYFYLQHTRPAVPETTAQASKIDGIVHPADTAVPPIGASEPTIRLVEQPRTRSEHAIAVPEKTPPSPRPVARQPRTDPAETAPRTAPPESKPVAPAVPLAPVATAVKPQLKVHGIAFQDGADSMAVINGVTVSNGYVIEGARVEEILKDRVRFSRGAEKFEIILDKSN